MQFPYSPNTDGTSHTAAHHNVPFGTIATIFAGNIGADNITGGSLPASVMQDAANPEKRYKKSGSNFVISGLTIPTSGTLSSTIASGEAFVNGKDVTPSGTAETFTASKDTYVDLKDDGTYVLVAVTLNATTGMTLTTNSDGSNALRIAKVVTSGSAVTTVVQSGADPLGNLIFNSSAAKVQGWVSFVPTITTATGTPPTYTGTSTGKYRIIGNSCRMQFALLNSSGGTVGSGAGALEFSLPVPAVTSKTSVATVIGGSAIVYNGAGTNFTGAFVNSATTGAIRNLDTSVLTAGGQSNAVRQLYVDLEFEIASIV